MVFQKRKMPLTIAISIAKMMRTKHTKFGYPTLQTKNIGVFSLGGGISPPILPGI